jgi:hypothetical protein
MDNELRNRDQLRYCVSLIESIKKSQRDFEKRKALEFVLNKLNAGIQRSFDRSRAFNTEV